MKGNSAQSPVSGEAAGVPYVALPPPEDGDRAPLVVAWHMMDPPRSEAAMAAALPLNGVPAWRVYLGLPMFGARAPVGGPEEIMRRVAEDYVLNLFGPIVEQAASEAPAAVAALRQQLPINNGPIGVVGGSAGGAVGLLVLAESELPVAAAALLNPVAHVAPVLTAGERTYGMTYTWTDESRAVADRLDFAARAGEIAKRYPQPPVLLVSGARDEPEMQGSEERLREALVGQYAEPDRVGFVSVPELAHALAEEPGMEPAPQTPGAKQVDEAVADWFRRHLAPA